MACNTERVKILAAELLRALRGRRSQSGFSRLLGYRSNPVALWETARRFPTAAETLAICERVGIDVNAAVDRLLYDLPRVEASDESVAALMQALRGDIAIGTVAERVECSRFTVGRWLSGQSRPRLHEFLAFLEATTGRAVDWVSALVPGENLPAARALVATKKALQKLTEREPFASAILHLLDTSPYRSLRHHRRGWIARRLGISVELEDRVLAAFEDAGVIERVDGKLRARHVYRIYGDSSEEGRRRKKKHWSNLAARRIDDPGPRDYFSYAVVTVSSEQLENIRAHLSRTLRATLADVANQESTDCVAVLNLQLIELSGPD